MKECPVCRRCFPDEVNHCPQDGDATTPTLLGEPTLDGRYLLERRLGQGGMGVVFQARHIFLKTAHAIKIILPDLVGNDPMLATRFRQEALAAAAIRHPNIIAVTDFGVVRGTMPFLVMEFVKGRSLQDLMGEEGAMAPNRAIELISAVAAGVGAAHRQNIVHRDLKPLNIMVQESLPVAEGLKILDFGLAKIKSGDLLGSFVQAKTSGLMGSPFYMAPEQWSDDEPDARADIYSLGVILYQMLAGEVPFKGSSIPSIMKKHLTMSPPTFQSLGILLPAPLEAVVRHALEKEVEARTDSVETFLSELRASDSSQVVVGKPRDTDALDLNRTIASTFTSTSAPVGENQDTNFAKSFDSMAGTVSGASLDQEMQQQLSDTAAARQNLKEEQERVAKQERESQDAARQAEALRVAKEEEQRRAREEEERLVRQEQERLAQQAEESRRAEEAKQKAVEEERKRAEAEQARAAKEAEAKFAAEERKRVEAEQAESERLAKEEEGRVAREEAEKRRLAQEAESKRTAEEHREAETRRLAEQQEKQRAHEERLRREQLEREQQEKIDRMTRQAKELEDRLQKLASSMPPAGPVVDSASGTGQQSFPPQSIPPSTMQQSFPPATAANSFPGVGGFEQSQPRITVPSTRSVSKSLLAAVAVVVILLISGAAVGGYMYLRHRRKTMVPPVVVVPRQKADLVSIDGGTFQMGRADGPPQETPPHSIKVQSFLMDKTEVTNAEYSDFIHDTNHAAPSHWQGSKPLPGQEQFPVVNVSFDDANAFAAWRSKRDGVAYRLPTEEEWEYAARNGDQDSLYPWGNAWQDKAAVVKETGAAPVGSRPAGQNRWGVTDLIGNVWEWTSSKVSVYPGNPVIIPETTRDWVTIRGGSYASDPLKPENPVSSCMRDFLPASTTNLLLGFRLVRTAY
ncbi:MAG: SUMF1/EgtB/PvdO family nonheme iron enzyme [Pyrinomonadaceae bacterium]